MSNVKRIHVCALGGTICSMANDPVEEYYNTASINIKTLIELLPLDKNEVEIKAEQLFQKISQDITYSDLICIARKLNELVQQDDVDGIVVTQGTNSIEETVFFMSLLVKTHKPIVFTGAFRPYSAFGYDGLRNLFNAIVIAMDKQVNNLGVTSHAKSHQASRVN
jgi:L-asparaginase